jgi:hypothetical protein
VSLGFFMTLLDLTIVNIAIPDLITQLHASLDDALWVINAYALVLSVLVITRAASATCSGSAACSTSASSSSPRPRPPAGWPRAPAG